MMVAPADAAGARSGDVGCTMLSLHAVSAIVASAAVAAVNRVIRIILCLPIMRLTCLPDYVNEIARRSTSFPCRSAERPALLRSCDNVRRRADTFIPLFPSDAWGPNWREQVVSLQTTTS